MNNTNKLPDEYLHVFINNTLSLQYDRRVRPNSEQVAYLDNMDTQMNSGFELNGTFHTNPDPVIRSQLVSQAMIHAIANKNEALAAAMCTWLGERFPDLRQVQAQGELETNIRVNLVFARQSAESQVA